MLIIDDLLLAPLNMFIEIAKTIDDQVQKETSDVTLIKQRLMELQFKLEFEEITEDEYYDREKELLEQLNNAQRR